MTSQSNPITNNPNLLQRCLSSFLCNIAKEYSIPPNDVEKCWNDASIQYKKVWDNSFRLHYNPDKKKLVFKEKPRDNVQGCQALLKSGVNKGEKCGLKLKVLKDKTNKYCGRHTRKEMTLPFLIYQNKFGNFEHGISKLIFNNDKLVHGRQLEDGKIADLTIEDVKLCYKYKFKHIKVVGVSSNYSTPSSCISNDSVEIDIQTSSEDDYENSDFEVQLQPPLKIKNVKPELREVIFED